jgi:hypothetical protein
MPSLRRGPREDRVPLWSGDALPAEPPAPSLYIRCRPCDCTAAGRTEPWDEWDEINRRAYARLRTARAPYPVAIVPGFHAGGYIVRYRARLGLKLLERGWVAALLLSGGHRRGGVNEARLLLDATREIAARERIDVAGRLLVEPCACHSSTNLRNSLRMMAALGLPRGLLVTDSKVSANSATFSANLDALVARDLGCAVGRVSHLFGTTSLQRLWGGTNGCRPPLGLRHNPLTFALPRREPVLFWVSPFQRIGGTALSALDCGPGAPHIRSCEPDDRDPFSSACLPPLAGGRCVR